MAPEATKELPSASIKFLFSVLKHCEVIKPDWQAVAEENGIKHFRNAVPRFKEILKKMGYAHNDSKIVELNTTPGPPAAPVTPKHPTKAKKNGTASTGKKRKAKDIEEENDDDNEVDGKAKVKGEDEWDDTGDD